MCVSGEGVGDAGYIGDLLLDRWGRTCLLGGHYACLTLYWAQRAFPFSAIIVRARGAPGGAYCKYNSALVIMSYIQDQSRRIWRGGAGGSVPD